MIILLYVTVSILMITFFAEAFVWACGVNAQCIDVTLIMITITFIEIWKEE